MSNYSIDIELARDLIALHGIFKRTQDNKIAAIPITLRPTPIKRQFFEKCIKIQSDLNLLLHNIACDNEFLSKILKCTSDDFLSHQWKIYEAFKDYMTRYQDPIIYLGLNRSDYMNVNEGPKQVEFNLMASSFGGLMPRVRSVHFELMCASGEDIEKLNTHIPPCPSDTGFANAILAAVNCYNDIFNGNGVVVFIVSETESNIIDQRIIERAIYYQKILMSNKALKVIRISFDELIRNPLSIKVDDDRKLWINNFEVALVYFRHGYSPEHFPDEKTWDLRLKLELNKAIKCPCIQYMLANTKLVQAGYSNSGFIKSKAYQGINNLEIIESTFAEQCTLSTEIGVNNVEKIELLISQARSNPGDFVLKPQREGGGNNFFDKNLIDKLDEIWGTEQQLAYILMRRLKPEPTRNIILSPDSSFQKEPQLVVSELGIFGAFLSIKKKDEPNCQVLLNEQCGHLLRTKPIDVNEGGVNSGFAALDSPFLID